MDKDALIQLMKARKAIKYIDRLEMGLARHCEWTQSHTDTMILDIVEKDIIPRNRSYNQRLIRKIVDGSAPSGEIELAWGFGRKINVCWRKEIWHDGITYKLKIKDMKDEEMTEYRFVTHNQRDNISVYVTGRDLY